MKKMIIRHDAAQKIVVGFLLLLLPLGHALKCLKCEGNCKDDDIGDPIVCRPGFDVCMKVKSAKQRVERVCGTTDACGFGVSENWGRRLYRQLQKAMGEAQKRSPWEQEDYEKRSEVFCCDSDFCNEAPGTTRPAGLLLASAHLVTLLCWRLFNLCF